MGQVLMIILFHCHAFGEVAWLVDVVAAGDGDVVGKKLLEGVEQQGYEVLDFCVNADNIICFNIFFTVCQN